MDGIYGYDLFGAPVERPSRGVLADTFMVPPFSVLSARGGYWQDRRRAWISFGIKSEIGRGKDLIRQGVIVDPDCYRNGSSANGLLFQSQDRLNEINGSNFSGTSIFDPVLCEVHYRWFSGPGAHVLDPFAGGSVRGIIAALLGRSYTGIELRAEQVAANRDQAEAICTAQPTWIEGDSGDVLAALPGGFDYLFTCPPYGDLEVYSDDPRDLSTMEYESFALRYSEIVTLSCNALRDNSFATFVVSNYRAPDGLYRDLVGLTIKACQRGGGGDSTTRAFTSAI